MQSRLNCDDMKDILEEPGSRKGNTVYKVYTLVHIYLNCLSNVSLNILKTKLKYVFSFKL